MDEFVTDTDVISTEEGKEELKKMLFALAEFHCTSCDDDFVAVIPADGGMQSVLITVSNLTLEEAASNDDGDIN